jgi:(p)ppGpp synthase/HD superfamily hydrolase
MINLEKIKEFAQKSYDDANCKYNDGNYFIHINMVVDTLNNHMNIFCNHNDFINTLAACYTHDLLEDAKKSYNDIKIISNKDVVDITLAVTDVPAENRLMRHLLTMGKTVRDYRAIILKMCDMLANAQYSKEHNSSMYKKYVEEYEYRKPIFKKALTWYKDNLDMDEVEKLWVILDYIHNNKNINNL